MRLSAQKAVRRPAALSRHAGVEQYQPIPRDREHEHFPGCLRRRVREDRGVAEVAGAAARPWRARFLPRSIVPTRACRRQTALFSSCLNMLGRESVSYGSHLAWAMKRSVSSITGGSSRMKRRCDSRDGGNDRVEFLGVGAFLTRLEHCVINAVTLEGGVEAVFHEPLECDHAVAVGSVAGVGGGVEHLVEDVVVVAADEFGCR